MAGVALMRYAPTLPAGTDVCVRRDFQEIQRRSVSTLMNVAGHMRVDWVPYASTRLARIPANVPRGLWRTQIHSPSAMRLLLVTKMMIVLGMLFVTRTRDVYVLNPILGMIVDVSITNTFFTTT